MIIIFRFFVVFILCVIATPSWALFDLCNYLSDPLVNGNGTWTNSESCYSTIEAAESACKAAELPGVPCECDVGFEDVNYPFCVTYDPPGEFRFSIFWAVGGDDTDGDGTPDDQDPCPNNPDPDCTSNTDTDGDGIPDNEDPCPTNPNPNCQDPNDPPGPGDPPDIPDEIPVGDCVFDLRSFKEWLNTGSAFPFNLLFRFVGLVTPLFDLTPEPPVFEIDWDLSSYHDKYSYIPSTVNFIWDFTPYDTYAKLIRSALILSIIIFVVSYGLNSSKERP